MSLFFIACVTALKLSSSEKKILMKCFWWPHLKASGSASDSYVNNLQLWVYQLYVCVSVQGNLAHFVPALYLANCCFITGWLLSLAIKPYNSVSPI